MLLLETSVRSASIDSYLVEEEEPHYHHSQAAFPISWTAIPIDDPRAFLKAPVMPVAPLALLTHLAVGKASPKRMPHSRQNPNPRLAPIPHAMSTKFVASVTMGATPVATMKATPSGGCLTGNFELTAGSESLLSSQLPAPQIRKLPSLAR